MDISNLSIEQLKALAYDLLQQIEVYNKDLSLVRARIAALQESATPQTEINTSSHARTKSTK